MGSFAGSLVRDRPKLAEQLGVLRYQAGQRRSLREPRVSRAQGQGGH